MPSHSADILEYGSCLDLIAGYAGSSSGRNRIRMLEPMPVPDTPAKLRQRVEATLELLIKEISMPVARFSPPTDILRQAKPSDSVLEIDLFHSLAELIDCGDRICTFLGNDQCRAYAALTELAQRFPDLQDLVIRLKQVFDDDGNIRDHATPRLAEIRQEIGQLERRIRRHLENILHSSSLADVIQEEHLSIRNQRYVIPVRREQKSRFAGVVHDQSNSGRTLFMEPSETIENGNDLAAARLEERDELRRILLDLTNLVRRHSPDLEQLARTLTDYDLVYAISHWANDYECRYVKPSDRLRIESARHPLLLAQFRQTGREAELVPLDLSLPSGTSVLVITGANAGGKTVALKTLGLLVLLAQAGLPVPCGINTCIPPYDEVIADIGDEQSLEQNLSTFSSHLTHIRDILNLARRKNILVLLDELGAGTDPVEGAALSCAVLHELSRQRGLTLATTHLAGVKQFVHEHPAMSNASVMFNEETLTPAFVLKIGRPGASHAMTIARTIGLPEDVLNLAASMLDSEHLHLETLLAKMEQDQRQLHEDTQAARALRESLEREHKALHDELQSLRRDRKKHLHDANRKAAAIVEDTRREMQSLLRAAKPGSVTEEPEELRHLVQAKKRMLQKSMQETRAEPARSLKSSELSIGLCVWIQAVNDHGTIHSIRDDGKRVNVDVGGIRFEVNAEELGPAEKSASQSRPQARVSVRKPVAGKSMGRELNLIGNRVEPALEELARFLDQAALFNLEELRVVHGFGTGALKQAVHEFLTDSPLVKAFRQGIDGKDPGGGGVTWIEL